MRTLLVLVLLATPGLAQRVQGLLQTAPIPVDQEQVEDLARHARRGRFERALESAEELVAVVEADPGTWNAEARAHARGLRACFEAALALDEEDRDRLAETWNDERRYRAALDRLELARARELLEGLVEERMELVPGLHPEVLRHHFELAYLSLELGEPEQAVAYSTAGYERALEHSADDSLLKAALLTQRAGALAASTETGDGLEDLRHAEAMLDRLDAQGIEREFLLFTYMFVDFSAGRVDAALERGNDLLEFMNTAYPSTSPHYVGVLAKIAETLMIAQRYTEAEALLSRVVAAASVDPEVEEFIGIVHYRALAELLERLGRVDEANRLREDAVVRLTAIHGPDGFETLLAKGRLALGLRAAGREAEAVELGRAAIAGIVASPTKNLRGLGALTELSIAFEPLERLARLEEAVLSFVAIHDRPALRYSWGAIESRSMLARYYERRGMLERALEEHGTALELESRTYGERSASVAERQLRLARLHAATEGLEAALPWAERAARAFEEARLTAPRDLSRALFTDSPYPLLAACRLEAGDAEGAWDAAERRHGRVLLDTLPEARTAAATEEELTRMATLRQRMASLDERMTVLRELAAEREDAGEDDPAARAHEEYLRARAELLALEVAVSERDPRGPRRPFELERVRASLADDEALIGWLDASVTPELPRLWAWVVRPNERVQWVELALPSDRTLADLRANYLDSIDEANALFTGAPDPTASRAAGRALHDILFAPLADALAEVEHVVAIPSDALAGLSLEVLVDADGSPLDERFTLSYTPSGTLLTHLRERARDEDRLVAALLVGDPPFASTHLAAMERERDDPSLRPRRRSPSGPGEALVRLPYTREEVETVGDKFPRTEVLVGPDANEARLVALADGAELAAFDVLHFATHAHADPERPHRSALYFSQVDLPDPFESALAGERIYDGRVTAAEILSTWRLDAELVTLSACASNVGREVPGEGTVGFAHAFLRTGARSLLVSQWPVDDHATALFMDRFYTEWLDSPETTKPEAARRARTWLRNYEDARGRRPYEHPCYWAAFVLVGE